MDPRLLLGESTHQDLAQLLKAQRRLVLSGASNETAKALLSACILSQVPSKTVMVTEKETMCEALRHWLQFFGEETEVLDHVID